MIKELVAFAFGSVVGSFLNVCIHRMPLGESIVWPRSRCPHCSKKIPGYDNIPFVSFLLLRGKCRHCGKPISWRYPLVEFVTASFFALLMWRYGPSYEFFYFVVFVSGLIIATFVDIQHRIIPDEVSVGGMVTGFLLHSAQGLQVSPFGWTFSPMVDSLLGIVVGGGVIYATGALFDLVYFKLLKKGPIQGETESMGGGDVKLLAMIGAFLGWKMALLTFFLAPFFGAAAGVVNLLVKKDHTIAYGPFLVIAALVSLFWSEPILNVVIYR
jgi:leader peptidase (prepilin peptidase) / N-methyltransferase